MIICRDYRHVIDAEKKKTIIEPRIPLRAYLILKVVRSLITDRLIEDSENHLYSRRQYVTIKISRWRYRKIRGDLISQSSDRDYSDRTIFYYFTMYLVFS